MICRLLDSADNGDCISTIVFELVSENREVFLISIMLHEVRNAGNFDCLWIPAGDHLSELVGEASDFILIDSITCFSWSDCAIKAKHLTWIDDNSNRGYLLDIGMVLQTYFNLHSVLTLIRIARRLNRQCLSVLIQSQEVLNGSFVNDFVEPIATVW